MAIAMNGQKNGTIVFTGGTGEKVGKRLLSCLPRVIFVDEGSKGQLSDIIKELTIRQGQVFTAT
jgi:hypothetical protein